ncbi:MAG: hypothetical protein HY017_26480 [Betaproteobacteria bacterium]|nr:hypothetical protein [Betaproteobacteria bacterium]
MRHLKATLAVIAVLVATVSIPALARGGHSGRSGGHAAHSGGARAHPGGHSGGARAHPGVQSGARHFAGPRVGVFLGAPLYAPYYYPPAPLYMEQAPNPNYWYFCPDSNAYYPYVQQCPGGWQHVVPQAPGSALNAPG